MTAPKLFATAVVVATITLSATAFAQDSGGIPRRSSEGRAYETVLDLDKDYQVGDQTYNTSRDLYWSKAKKDYAAIAEDYVSAYSKNTDTFSRQDMLKTLQPQLDAFYNSAQKIKNVSVKTRFSLGIGAYTPGKGFHVSTSFDEAYYLSKQNKKRGDSDGAYYILLLSPHLSEKGDDYYFNPSEADARKLEAYLSANRTSQNESVLLKGQVNGYVLYTETQGTNRWSVIAPDSITLLGKNREPIATIGSNQMDKSVYISSDYKPPQVRDLLGRIKKEHGITEKKSKTLPMGYMG